MSAREFTLTDMSLCKTICLDYDEEMKNTRTLLERIVLDDAHRDFAPHAKSMPLARLATHVAELPNWMKTAVTTDSMDLPADFQSHVIATTEELLSTFDKCVAEGRVAIDSASDEELAKNWSFSFAGQHVFTSVKGDLIRQCLNHLIHHRAQLSVYLRLLEIPVPGMYGPSADDVWPAK